MTDKETLEAELIQLCYDLKVAADGYEETGSIVHRNSMDDFIDDILFTVDQILKGR